MQIRSLKAVTKPSDSLILCLLYLLPDRSDIFENPLRIII